MKTILLVEDSVKFYSSFLPVVYSELWRQNKIISRGGVKNTSPAPPLDPVRAR